MELFFYHGSPGWRDERHDELFRRLAFRFGTWADGPSHHVFVERFALGVRIKLLAGLSESEQLSLIAEATRIYQSVMSEAADVMDRRCRRCAE